jgi:hypothetical protein
MVLEILYKPPRQSVFERLSRAWPFQWPTKKQEGVQHGKTARKAD